MKRETLSDDLPSEFEDVGIAAPAEPLVCVRSLNHFYGTGAGRSQVLFDVELSLMSGELVAVTGPSGAGKSTLLTLIGGLRSVQHGKIKVLGLEMRGLAGGRLTLLRRRIGFIFQSPHLLESLTAQQNVQIGLNLHKDAKRCQRSRSIEILRRVGLGDRLHYKPRHLSGGERQRVGIARTLVHHPMLILADEPTAALDKGTADHIIDLLKEEAEAGAAVFVVTHDADVIGASTRTVTVANGSVHSD